MAGFSTELCNKSLRNLGISREVSDVNTENSQEAKACRAFYEDCVEETLRDAALPFSRRPIRLALVEENPLDEDFLFSYRYPAQCAQFRGLIVGNRLPLSFEYKISSDNAGQLILCNIKEAIGEYIHLVEDVDMWPSDLRLAFSYKLSVYIGPSLMSGDQFNMIPKCEAAYIEKIDKAKANGYNEESSPRPPESELVRAHDGLYFRDYSYPISGRKDS